MPHSGHANPKGAEGTRDCGRNFSPTVISKPVFIDDPTLALPGHVRHPDAPHPNATVSELVYEIFEQRLVELLSGGLTLNGLQKRDYKGIEGGWKKKEALNITLTNPFA